MSNDNPPFRCAVCGQGFHATPKIKRWIADSVIGLDLASVMLCWVCTRLRASVQQEAAEMAKAWEERP